MRLHCTRLVSVTIPTSVTSIGNSAFATCYDLASALFTGSAPSMGTGVFASAASSFTVYYYNGAAGFTSPTWNGYPAVGIDPPPTETTGTVTETVSNGTTLNGTVDPNGLATTYRFQYGTTASFGSTTGTQSAGSGTNAVLVSTTLTGLNPSTTYYYQLVATNSSGTTYGPVQSFTTTQALGFTSTTAKIAQSGSNVQVSIPSLLGYSYQLQRANSLSITTVWQPIGGVQPGTGSVLALVDSGGALASCAFYRVQISQ